MSSIRINLSMALITLVILISALEIQHGVLANEQINTTNAKPESPLWQISSTQSSIAPTSSSSSIVPTTSLGPVISSSQSPPSPSVSSISGSHNTARDEIYIDDEGLEGSGRGEIHDDLEKEPEYSGSGFGPDDEDSSSSSSSHQRKKGNAGHKGSGGHKSTNSKNHSQESISDKTKKQPEKPIFTPDTNEEDDLDSGSGDKIDIDETDDEDRHIISPDEGDNDNDENNRQSGNKFDTNSGGEDGDDDLTTEIEEKILKIDDIPNIKSQPDPEEETDVISGGEGNEIDLDRPGKGPVTGKPSSPIEHTNTPTGNEVFIMDKSDDRTASFFAQPGILAAVIGGAVVGLLCAILVVMFIVYRMRKKDEGSYALEEPSKRSPAVNSYAKNANNREFYA